MAFYLFLLFIIIGMSIIITISHLPSSVKSKTILYFVGMFLLFIAVFRGVTVGADYYVYLSNLVAISDRSYWDVIVDETLRLEKGYITLAWFLGSVSVSPLFFSLIIYSLFLFLSFRVIGKYSQCVWLSLFLFVAIGFYTNSFNTLRQSLSMCICWCALSTLLANHKWKFLLLVFIAFLFHKTAILFACMVLLRKRIGMKHILLLLSVTFLIAMSLGPIINIAVQVFQLIDYTDSDEEGGGTTLLIFYFIMLFVMNYVAKKQSELKNNRVIDIFLNMLLIAMLLQILALKLPIITRCTEFFRFSLVILVPNILMSFKKKERMFLVTGCVILFAFYFVITNRYNLAGIIPYEFISF